MERPVFFSDQLVMADDLNAINGTFASQSILRTLAGLSTVAIPASYSVVGGGVFGSPLESNLNKNLKVVRMGGWYARVAVGMALETSGEIISLLNTQDLIPGWVRPEYSWSDSSNGSYYIKIRYQGGSGSTKVDDYGASYFTRYTEGYFITVDKTAPLVNELCLATASVAGGDVQTILDTRSYVTIRTPAQGVIIDPTLNRVPSVRSAYDHIIGIGTGIVTVKNPHGVNSNDIGATSLAQASLFGTPTIGNVTFNTVYRNIGGSAMYFEASLTTVSGGIGPLNSYSVYVSATGTLTDATGSLSGTIREIARFASQISQSKSTDTMTMQEYVRGIIPSMWYYKIGSTTGTAAPVGSIKFTTTSI